MPVRTCDADSSPVWCLNIKCFLRFYLMLLNRRDFLILTAGLAAGCGSISGNASSSGQPTVINAGAVENYAADGVYSRFLKRGFFVVRKNGKLFALSSTCTHRKCALQVESDRSFY